MKKKKKKKKQQKEKVERIAATNKTLEDISNCLYDLVTIESAENLLKKALPKGVRIKKQLDRGKFSAWIEDTGEQLSFEMEDLRDIFDEKNEDNTLKALTEFYNECRNALGHPACSSSDQSVDTDDI